MSEDRWIATFLVVATVLSAISWFFPEQVQPFAELFAWGPAEVISQGGWMIVLVSGIVATVAAARPR
jgi:hypothetical protein